MVMFDWGGMPQKTVFHSMELFAKHVMPHFREAQPDQTSVGRPQERSAAQALP
jgi:hypothetical protein